MKTIIRLASAISLIIVSGCTETRETLFASDIYMIDGDTAEIRGERYRLVGFDTPETYRAKCQYEQDLGQQATKRARTIIAQTSEIELISLGQTDKFGRRLGRLIVEGRDLGSLLISEKLARPYHGGKRRSWC